MENEWKWGRGPRAVPGVTALGLVAVVSHGTWFHFSFDDRLIASGSFGVRRSKDGVTLTDDSAAATFGFLSSRHRFRTSPVPIARTTAGGPQPRPGLDEGRWPHLRDERSRRGLHPLPRQGAVTARRKGTHAYGDCRGSGWVGARSRGMSTPSVRSSRSLNRPWRGRGGVRGSACGDRCCCGRSSGRRVERCGRGRARAAVHGSWRCSTRRARLAKLLARHTASDDVRRGSSHVPARGRKAQARGDGR